MIRKLVATALFLPLLATPAFADDNTDLIVVQAMQPDGCLSNELQEGDAAIVGEAEFKIKLKDDGYTESVEILSYTPDDENGKRVADAIVRSIEACMPYLADGGEYTIKMWPGMPLPE